jgi:hypothetical protein
MTRHSLPRHSMHRGTGKPYHIIPPCGTPARERSVTSHRGMSFYSLLHGTEKSFALNGSPVFPDFRAALRPQRPSLQKTLPPRKRRGGAAGHKPRPSGRGVVPVPRLQTTPSLPPASPAPGTGMTVAPAPCPAESGPERPASARRDPPGSGGVLQEVTGPRPGAGAAPEVQMKGDPSSPERGWPGPYD